MALVQMNFESEYLGSNHEISVILPDKPREKTPRQFYGSGERYPVLWLLHGTFGDHSDWVRKSNVELYACERDVIVVMVSGLNSNYVNWKEFGIGYNMWDYLTEELMPLIWNWFPASSKREDNFIAGLSMGGTGTIQYAVGHPELFAGAAVLSSAPVNVRAIPEEGSAFGEERQAIMLKNAGGFEAYVESNENVWDKLPAFTKLAEKPKLYFAIGKQDFLYDTYAKFKAYAKEIGLEATFEEYDGFTHEWRFWDMTIEKALDFFGLCRKDAGNPF